MGFMDKVKAATQDVAAQAKTATATAQTKMEQAQLKKKMDESARRLGYLIYKERTQGTPLGAEGDSLVSDIAGYEAAIAAQAAETPAAQGGDQGTAAATPPVAPQQGVAPEEPVPPPTSAP